MKHALAATFHTAKNQCIIHHIMEHFEKTISSRRIHEGRIINMREDTVLLPSGREAKREIIEHRGAVCVLPVLDDGSIVMVRQFRKPVEEALLEIPAGGLNPDEDPEICAERELMEECTLRPTRLTRLFSCFLAPGYSSELIHCFLAEGLEESEPCPEEDENIELEIHTLDALLAMVDDGRIRDSKTICALLALYRRRRESA